MFVLLFWLLSVFVLLFFVLVLRACALLLFVALRSFFLFAVIVRRYLVAVIVMCCLFVLSFLFVFFVRVLRVRVIVRATGRVLCVCARACALFVFAEFVLCSCSLLSVRCACS